VILVRNRRPEERHDPVPHHLIHRALVTMDRFHHVLKHWVKDLSSLLRIAVCEKLHRALEIGEQHGHLLTLAFERCL
jgi:hypothetical protein